MLLILRRLESKLKMVLVDFDGVKILDSRKERVRSVGRGGRERVRNWTGSRTVGAEMRSVMKSRHTNRGCTATASRKPPAPTARCRGTRVLTSFHDVCEFFPVTLKPDEISEHSWQTIKQPATRLDLVQSYYMLITTIRKRQ